MIKYVPMWNRHIAEYVPVAVIVVGFECYEFNEDNEEEAVWYDMEHYSDFLDEDAMVFHRIMCWNSEFLYKDSIGFFGASDVYDIPEQVIMAWGG